MWDIRRFIEYLDRAIRSVLCVQYIASLQYNFIWNAVDREVTEHVQSSTAPGSKVGVRDEVSLLRNASMWAGLFFYILTYFLNSFILIYKVTYTYMKLVINFTVNLFVNSVYIFGLFYEIY